MQIGSAWMTDKGISIKPEDVICELYPELKNVRFMLKAVPIDQRKSDTSPDWKLECYKPSQKYKKTEQTEQTAYEQAPAAANDDAYNDAYKKIWELDEERPKEKPQAAQVRYAEEEEIPF